MARARFAIWRSLLAGLLAAVAVAAQTAAPPDVVVVHFNDFHGQIRPRITAARPGRPAAEEGGFSRLAAYVEEQRAAFGDRVWVTDGGDWFQGTPEGNEDHGVAVMECFDRLGVTASVVGNHEFDFGDKALIHLIELARHPVLGANILERGSDRPRPYVRPYVVREVRPRQGGGAAVRVALVGLVTHETPTVSTGPFGGARFGDEVATLRRLWPVLEREADDVVLLTHCGVDTDRVLAKAFPRVALILAGHDHRWLRQPVHEGDTVIVESGSRAAAVTRVELRAVAGHLAVGAADFVELDASHPTDPATDRFLTERFAQLDEKWDAPLGALRGVPDRRRSEASSPAGSLVAALVRRAGHAEIGLTNKGGLRTTWAPGPLTRRRVFEMLPFENSVVTFALTGRQLWRLLGAGLRSGKRPLEIDGGRYTFAVRDGVRHLVAMEVAGRPLDRLRVYRVATNSFLAGGGDGFTAFRKARRVLEVPRLLRELVLAELRRSGFVELPGDDRILHREH